MCELVEIDPKLINKLIIHHTKPFTPKGWKFELDEPGMPRFLGMCSLVGWSFQELAFRIGSHNLDKDLDVPYGVYNSISSTPHYGYGIPRTESIEDIKLSSMLFEEIIDLRSLWIGIRDVLSDALTPEIIYEVASEYDLTLEISSSGLVRVVKFKDRSLKKHPVFFADPLDFCSILDAYQYYHFNFKIF